MKSLSAEASMLKVPVENPKAALERHFGELLELLGEDPDREGLRETPRRAAQAWLEWTSGYALDAVEALKVFSHDENSGGTSRESHETILVGDIPLYSHCEHHLAPFFGVAHIAYIPAAHVVGLSKMQRLVHVLSRRLQVQERLTNEIANAVEKALKPMGVAVTLRCRHLCMESRGIRSQGVHTTTSVYRGKLLEDALKRQELLQLMSRP